MVELLEEQGVRKVSGGASSALSLLRRGTSRASRSSASTTSSKSSEFVLKSCLKKSNWDHDLDGELLTVVL